MEITIRRIHKNDEVIDGRLSINDKRVCDTAENRETALPAGDYPIQIVQCKQYGKRCMCVGNPNCETCRQLKQEMVFSNTLMPQVCPMLKMGNGVIGRTDGSIIVGERVGTAEHPVWGRLVHPKEAFDRVFDRVRKNIERGNEVTLRII